MENQRKNQDKSLRSGERQIRSNLNDIEFWHKWRYNEACNYISKNDLVLDVGMGCGYGSFIMSKFAKEVRGIDDSEEAVEYAKQNWLNSNIKYFSGNALDLIHDYPFDVIVAFEIIEHIKDDKELISLFKRTAQKYIVISVPHISVPLSRSRWHHRHYTEDDIKKLFVDENWEIERLETPIFGKGKAIFAVLKRTNCE